jgi:transcriptional regulator with XRE-family HTH domain
VRGGLDQRFLQFSPFQTERVRSLDETKSKRIFRQFTLPDGLLLQVYENKREGDNAFDGNAARVYGGCGNPQGFNPTKWLPMGTFGEDLRAERLSRGIALEDITEITKISQRHLVALEQDHFRLLPGGILAKGIVRGYVKAVGLDADDWTQRFLRANSEVDSADAENDHSWEAFATNVGRVRMEQREAAAQRLRWAGAIVLMFAAAMAAFVTVRYFGLRAGWWDSLMPMHSVSAKTHAMLIQSFGLFLR